MELRPPVELLLDRGAHAERHGDDCRTEAPTYFWIAGGKIDRTEMYQVFNMGIGMTVIVAADDRARALQLTRGRVIGRIEKGTGVVRLEFPSEKKKTAA
ncbi:MAG: hypothetical protein QOE70_5189 [Chthoniobacter sp.]|jgi:phosphoribosylaminoimidazole (AIR) synthetase|nr:hypothetical protein [Chthoniobacter sp.]